AVARDGDAGRAVEIGRAAGRVVARLEQVEADRATGGRGRPAEAGVVGQRVADLAARLARGRPECGRVGGDDDRLVAAAARGGVVVGVAGVLGQPVVGAGLGGDVAAGLGRAVGAVVGAVARDGDAGRAV